MLKQTARGFDPGQHINFGGSDRDYVDLGSYQDLVYQHENETNIGIRLEWVTSSGFDWQFKSAETSLRYRRRIEAGQRISYEVGWNHSDSISLCFLGYESYGSSNSSEFLRVNYDNKACGYVIEVFQPPQSDDLARSNLVKATPESCFIIPEDMLSVFPIDVRRLSAFYSREFASLTGSSTYLGPLRQTAKRQYLWTGSKPSIIEPDGANTIEMLISSAREDSRLLFAVEERLKALDLADTFNVKPIDQNRRLYEATATIAGVESSLIDVGFGVSQVLPIITMLLSAPDRSIILVGATGAAPPSQRAGRTSRS